MVLKYRIPKVLNMVSSGSRKLYAGDQNWGKIISKTIDFSPYFRRDEMTKDVQNDKVHLK